MRTILTAAAICLASACFAQPSTGDKRVDFLIALAQRESSGNQRTVNQYRYLGLFQMGTGALVDANFYVFGPSDKGGRRNAWDGTFSARARFVGVDSESAYLESAGAQEIAVRAYHDIQWDRIVRLRLDSKIGSVIAGIELSKSGMTAGAHLLGVGALLKFVRSNGDDIVRDGNGVPITDYLEAYEAYY